MEVPGTVGDSFFYSLLKIRYIEDDMVRSVSRYLNLKIYYNIENLVLWARSEKIGCAVNICSGMMEYWNVGILGLAVRFCAVL